MTDAKHLSAIVEIVVAEDGEHCGDDCHYGQDETCSLVPSATGRNTAREEDPIGRGLRDRRYFRCRACRASEVGPQAHGVEPALMTENGQ